jgi:hypothetical protein
MRSSHRSSRLGNGFASNNAPPAFATTPAEINSVTARVRADRHLDYFGQKVWVFVRFRTNSIVAFVSRATSLDLPQCGAQHLAGLLHGP